MRRSRQQPAALTGLWLDVDHSTPSDTAFWRLAPDGTWRPFHRRISPAGRAASDERFAPRHGAWYVQGALADTPARVLCTHNSRVAAYCVGFSLDTTVDGTRRLRLREYRGAFSVPARTFVERP